MRALVVLAVAALAAVVGLLVFRGGEQPENHGAPAGPVWAERRGEPAPPPRLPGIAERVAKLQRAPEVQGLLEDFVAKCVQRGEEAVPELADLLRNERDVTLALRWTHEGGRLRQYPSLRAAYITALLSIPGRSSRDALLEALDVTASADEALLIASGLNARGARGWTLGALEQAGKESGPRYLETRKRLVALAAQADAAETAAQIVARAPRGNDPKDPQVLASGLKALPLDRAAAAASQLLADPLVTRKAKERYVRNLADRKEPEAIRRLRDLLDRGEWDLESRLSIAYAAAGSGAFYADAKEYELARAGGDPASAPAIKARYQRRLEEVELLVAAALAEFPASDPRRASLQRLIRKARARLR